MPLVPPLLTSQILAAFQKQSAAAFVDGYSVTQAQVQLAQDLAIAIDNYIRSATIIVPPGQAVATAGTPVAQTGATIAPSVPAIIT
jgi:hypothetical protein